MRQHRIEPDVYARYDKFVGVVYVDGYLVEKQTCDTEQAAWQWAEAKVKEKQGERK